MNRAAYFIAKLQLEPHIEGGFFRELYHSSQTIPAHSERQKDNQRYLSSTIYYLLRSGEVSRFHRLKSDEIWFYHYGAPVIIHIIDELGQLKSFKLGLNADEGESPQFLIPANQVFGAEVSEKDSFSLVSCMVSPGFEYADFELFSAETLIKLYPQHKEMIHRLNG